MYLVLGAGFENLRPSGYEPCGRAGLLRAGHAIPVSGGRCVALIWNGRSAALAVSSARRSERIRQTKIAPHVRGFDFLRFGCGSLITPRLLHLSSFGWLRIWGSEPTSPVVRLRVREIDLRTKCERWNIHDR
jgi:hypothetical protein